MTKKLEKQTVKLDQNAMRFVDDSCSAAVKFSEEEGGTKVAKLEMVAYSGGVIKDHWWWGDLAIDLAGMSFPKKKIPILEDHMTYMKIGFATKMSTENHQLTVAESTFIDSEESIKFRENSAGGFPYEASMYARPSVIEQLTEGETAEVNGYTFKGPGTIWRKCALKEVSVCTFGYDPNTKSAAMSENNEELLVEYLNKAPEGTQFTNKGDVTSMTKEQFKKDHPEQYELLVSEIAASEGVKFTAKITDLEAQLTASKKENETLSAENKDTEKRLVALELQDAKRKEREIFSQADKVFAEKFSASSLPDRLNGKIRKLVDHEKFVENGVLDTEKFGAAVEAELADWKGSVTEEPEVLGFSHSSKNFGNETDSKVVDDTVSRMLGHCGMSKK